MPSATPATRDINLTFSAPEWAQLEAFAALHGVAVAAFLRNAALEAAHIALAPSQDSGGDNSWMTDALPVPAQQKTANLWAFNDEPKPAAKPGNAEETVAAKRGVAGEPSKLARGQGPVWEIRQALGKERVHGLGWTREQLAFVMKLSVVGVRKMEHLGTSPIKSRQARQGLLTLAKTLENPTPEIIAYIAAEEAALDA